VTNQTSFLKRLRINFSSFGEIWLFIQIFCLIVILPLMLRFFSLPTLPKVLTPKKKRTYKKLYLGKSKDTIVKFTDYILSRDFWINRNTCLKRSLVLYYFLRRIGVNVRVCLGVRYYNSIKTGDVFRKLEGHAWLLYKGKPYLENQIANINTFKTTYCFPDE
jgi:hypothetical protein